MHIYYYFVSYTYTYILTGCVNGKGIYCHLGVPN